jgi:hypothetical protein
MNDSDQEKLMFWNKYTGFISENSADERIKLNRVER